MSKKIINIKYWTHLVTGTRTSVSTVNSWLMLYSKKKNNFKFVFIDIFIESSFSAFRSTIGVRIYYTRAKWIHYNLSPRRTKPTIILVRPSKTQISLRIRAVWSESSLIACAFYSSKAIQIGMNENPCHTEWMHRHSGSVIERPLCDREVVGSIPGRVIPKTLKKILAALSLALSIKKVQLELVSSVSV